MGKKKFFSKMMYLHIICFLLITGCVSASRPIYEGRTFFLRLESLPRGAKVLLDGTQKGYTPMTLKFTYLRSKRGGHSDETKERMLRIEKKGYEPYIYSFSIKGKEYERIPDTITLKQPVDAAEVDRSDNQDEIQEPIYERIPDTVTLKQQIDVEEVGRFNIQYEIQELIKAREKYRESLGETEKPVEAAAFKENEKQKDIGLEKDIKSQVSSEDKDITHAEADKEIDNKNRLIEEMGANGPYASELFYTIQTGTFINAANARKQFDSIIQKLNKEEISYLRIEKIGKLFPVRLGKFEGYSDAVKLLREIKQRFSRAMIVHAYIKSERILSRIKKAK